MTDRENLMYLFEKNDFILSNQPILSEILTVIIELSTEKQDKDDFKYITSASNDILVSLLTFSKHRGKQLVDRNITLPYYTLYT